MSQKLDQATLTNFVNETWDSSIIPTLEKYISIPNQSPMFDKEWNSNGLQEQAVELMVEWVKNQKLSSNYKLEVVKDASRTPVIFMDIPATGDDQKTVLLYGHCDKQPPMTGWDEGLGPYTPVIKDGKLYGRGGADDGYAIFASITAIKALQQQNVPHARCVILIEACEESGSKDLPFYVDALKDKIGNPDFIVCLDSGCANYEQLWMTTSLRGLVSADLRVKILNEGVHSGDASGVVPSSFRILRQLLSRLENEKTGEIIPKEFHVEIPQERIDQAKIVANIIGDKIYTKFPFVEGAGPVQKEDVAELLLNKTWRSALSITGVDGLPTLASAGNVLRTETAVKLSLRIPPSLDPKSAIDALRNVLESNPPYGAQVKLEGEIKASPGWDAPPTLPWLAQAAETASNTYYSKPPCFTGEGGSIPFMGMLGEKFPKAQFLITGLLGPQSNAHGPNEFLHIEFGKRLTCCVSSILADHNVHQ